MLDYIDLIQEIQIRTAMADRPAHALVFRESYQPPVPELGFGLEECGLGFHIVFPGRAFRSLLAECNAISGQSLDGPLLAVNGLEVRHEGDSRPRG